MTIEPAPDAPEGSVTVVPSWQVTDIGPDDAVLCRNNAPLLRVAFRAIRQQRPVRYLGKDLGSGLTRMLESFDGGYPTINQLQDYETRERKKLLKKNKFKSVDLLADRCECLRIVLRHCANSFEATSLIKKLFDSGTGITLSTVHKAKGLEWETVWILNRGLMPSPYAITPEDLEQEMNMLHVAITRAKLHLKYITI